MRKTIDLLQDKMRIDSNSKILEVGVGTGRIAIPLAEKLKTNTIGIDISVEMLQKCQEKMSSKSSAAKIQLIVADGLKLPFTDNQFDIILTCHVTHLLSNAYQFVKIITPLLIKNGYYVNLSAYVDYGQTLPFKIYYDKLSETGFRPSHQGDLIRRGLIIYLSRRKWNHLQCIIESKRQIGMKDLVRFIRDRVFSHLRAIDDDHHHSAFEYLLTEIENNEIDLSKKVFAPAKSRLHIFQRQF